MYVLHSLNMSYLIYENTVANMFIVSMTPSFHDLPDTHLKAVASFEDINFPDLLEQDYQSEIVYILCSSYVKPEILDKYIPDHTPFEIRIIMKDAEECVRDNYSIMNWYIHWSTMTAQIHSKYGIELAIAYGVADYYVTVPTDIQRRIMEYLDRLKYESRTRFIEVLSNQSCQSMNNYGKAIIDGKQREIDVDKSNASTKVINHMKYTYCVSNYIETAFQLLKKSPDFVILFVVNLKKYTVTGTIISRDETKRHYFSGCITHKLGTYMERFTLTFDEFIDFIRL